MAIALPEAVQQSADKIAQKVAEKDWAAGFRVSMTGIQARMDLEDVDPVTKLVRHGPNAGRSGNEVLTDAATALGTLQNEVDTRVSRAVTEARDPGALGAGITLDTLTMRVPEMVSCKSVVKVPMVIWLDVVTFLIFLPKVAIG